MIVSVFSVAALSLKLITTEAKVILAPGLNQEVWTSDKGVSISYLEETSAMYLPLLLDLTSDSIDWKKELLMNHVSQSDAKYMRLINEYFDLFSLLFITFLFPKSLFLFFLKNFNLPIVRFSLCNDRYF